MKARKLAFKRRHQGLEPITCRALPRFAFFIRLPPPAGGDIQTCQPTAIYRTRINADRNTQIQDLAGSLG
jgi:hypothetical protein